MAMRHRWKSGSVSDRTGMSTISFVVGAVLWTAVLISATLLFLKPKPKAGDQEGAATPQTTEKDSDSPDESVTATTKTVRIGFPTRKLPDFEFPECMGGTISLNSLKGKRWVANFVFTRCNGPCPMMTRDMSLLHKSVAKTNPDFLFVTFSVDSSYDTVDVLRKYAETFMADHERWKFVTGDEDKIHDLIRRGFVLPVQVNVGEMRKPGFEVAHSNRAVLVNEDGIPVASYLMNVPEDVVKLRRVIEGKSEFPLPGPLLAEDPTGENPNVPLTLVPVDSASSENPGDEASQKSPSEDPETEDRPREEEAPDAADGRRQRTSTESSDSNSDSITPPAAQESPAAPVSAAEKNKIIDSKLPQWVARLPDVNASLNAGSTVLLLTGYYAIRRGQPRVHRNLMIAAFVVSVVFLACYLTYHEALFRYTEQRGRAFTGTGAAAVIYKAILYPHIALAVFVPFLAIRVFIHAFRENWLKHRRLAKLTFPIWLFVSVTGVVIYGMLYHWPA